MTLFWAKEGPKVSYDGDTLSIDDLNPQVHLRWRMSRWELLRLAYRAALAACRRATPAPGTAPARAG